MLSPGEATLFGSQDIVAIPHRGFNYSCHDATIVLFSNLSTVFSEFTTVVYTNCGMSFGVNSLRHEIAKAIRRSMEKAHLADHKAVAEKTRGKITSEGVRKILQGDVAVKVETLFIIAEALGTTAAELLLDASVDSTKDIEARVAIEHRRILEDYDDIPPQCQKDVRDLLQVLRLNHSVSERKLKREVRRRDVAATTRQASSGSARPEAQSNEKENDQNGPVRRIA